MAIDVLVRVPGKREAKALRYRVAMGRLAGDAAEVISETVVDEPVGAEAPEAERPRLAPCTCGCTEAEHDH